MVSQHLPRQHPISPKPHFSISEPLPLPPRNSILEPNLLALPTLPRPLRRPDPQQRRNIQHLTHPRPLHPLPRKTNPPRPRTTPPIPPPPKMPNPNATASIDILLPHNHYHNIHSLHLHPPPARLVPKNPPRNGPLQYPRFRNSIRIQGNATASPTPLPRLHRRPASLPRQ